MPFLCNPTLLPYICTTCLLLIYIYIAGCNGAGKTTASFSVLPSLLKCKEFVNADEIARGLSPFNPDEMAIEAGRLMIDRINQLLNQKKTFAIETTPSTRSYINLIRRAKTLGYKVSLLFFWLPSTDMAKKRVEQRVKSGGHNIPADVIERRYYAGLSNLFNIFINEVDYWSIFDNTNSTTEIANEKTVLDVDSLNKIKKSCPPKKD